MPHCCEQVRRWRRHLCPPSLADCCFYAHLIAPPPPLPSYPTPITAIACPSIGIGVKIALKITIGGDESPKKNESAGIRSRKLVAARPLTDDSLMGGGLSLGGEMAPIS
jgi:hypothetical protein